MTEPAAISVRNLSKTYQLGEMKPYDTLRDKLAGVARGILGRNGSSQQAVSAAKSFTALNDLSFDVQPGEILGVIGRNGAGKSTLLKILARVTAPTKGEIVLRGHLAPLLEVGTGFNHELTGRENIFVNGTLLGMSQSEIEKKLDSIIAFAGVEAYIDTPVKRYSSGMVVRLGFAVAAHLEPEIMLVDEVLAVGDAAFQKRCLGKMNEISRRGRTVVFVSHNMEAVQNLCTRVIWIDKGHIRMDGQPRRVVSEYVKAALADSGDVSTWIDQDARPGNGNVRLTDVKVVDETGMPTRVAIVGQKISIEIAFVAPAGKASNVSFRMWLRNDSGREPVGFMTTMTGQDLEWTPAQGRVTCHIPRLNVGPGQYTIRALAVLGQELGDEVDTAATLEIIPGDYFNSGNSMTEYMDFVCDHSWSTPS
jgi:lipopolysaccharide transport system ATP-binding protein